jgi:hypothetical protein
MVIFSYILMLDSRGRKLRKELERVRKMLDGGDKRSAS